MKQVLNRLLDPLALMTSHWIGALGVFLTTTGGILWLFLLPTMLRGESANPYTGILTFLILPGVFFAGLALIPIGWWFARRSGAARRPDALRHFLIFLGVTTGANLLIGSQFTYRAVRHMESVQFCGQTCHTVMEPEFVAHQNSPHSRVSCTACHIGEGADWFVKSKLSGVRQVFAVVLNTYSKPIPTPVHNLRPARETCEQCHWPQKYGADRLRRIASFADDEANTRSDTVLLMHIGGGEGSSHGPGIHGAHLGDGVVIHYRTGDEKRLSIPYVEVEKNGAKEVYLASGAKREEAEKLPLRTMDCIDCHTRPSHTFELPERAVNTAMDRGAISPALPFVKKQAVELLKASYPNPAEAERQITGRLKDFYKEKYPAIAASKQTAIAQATQSLTGIWKRNVFPAMNVTWGAYPNQIGHTDFPGCFRCHDGEHASQAGNTIQQDCNACHQLLAMEEVKPKILSELGLEESGK
ncbi:MAG: NapC/NirT family cytochrome c [Bryobacterales bacterium]|nr:NapC/NirT family cytochrome c [Bryobacterales bacterium]